MVQLAVNVKTKSPHCEKGDERQMMDIIMVAILAVSFLLVKLFADWCEGQIEK